MSCMQLIVASTVGAAFLFALAASLPTEKFGRKVTILSASLVFVLGSVIMALAPSKEILLGNIKLLRGG